jgi:DNA-binding transcriptional LysR family regulator
LHEIHRFQAFAANAEVNVSEVIDTSLKRAAIVLAETLNYDRAAESLNIPVADLRNQIADLEARLCLYIFEPETGDPKLTGEGRILVGVFRKSLRPSDGQSVPEV